MKDGILDGQSEGKVTRLILCPPLNAITEYEAPDTLKSTDPFSFRNVTTLKKVVLREGFETLGYSTFNGCGKLKDISLPDSLKSVGAFAFSSVSAEGITFGNDLELLDDSALSFMDSLKHVVIRGGNGTVVNWSMATDHVETLYYGDGVKEIAGDIGGAALKTVVLGKNIDTIESNAFTDASNITFYATKGTRSYELGEEKVNQILELGNTAKIKEYQPIEASLQNVQTTVGEKTKVMVTSKGGIGTKNYRFVVVNSDGTETELQGYSSSNTVTVDVPEDGVKVRAYVRDTTWYEVSSDLSLDIGEEMGDGEYAAAIRLQDPQTKAELFTDVYDGYATITKKGDEYTIGISFKSGNVYSVTTTSPDTETIQIQENGTSQEVLLQIDWNSLTIPADKTELQIAIDRANALVQDDYTTKTYRTVYLRLQDANKVNENLLATQSEVVSATDALIAAIENLRVEAKEDREYLGKIKIATAEDGSGSSMVNAILGNPAHIIKNKDDWSVDVSFVDGNIMGVSVNGQAVDSLQYEKDGKTEEAERIYDNAEEGTRTFRIKMNQLTDIVLVQLTYTISGSTRSNEAYILLEDPDAITVYHEEDIKTDPENPQDPNEETNPKDENNPGENKKSDPAQTASSHPTAENSQGTSGSQGTTSAEKQSSGGTNTESTKTKSAKTVTIGNIIYKVSGKKAIVSGVKKSKAAKIKKLIIPKSIKVKTKTYSVTGIGKKAFAKCKKLKKLRIKTVKLKKNNIHKKAFSQMTVETTIYVPKTKMKSYKKIFRSKGLNKKIKVK